MEPTPELINKEEYSLALVGKISALSINQFVNIVKTSVLSFVVVVVVVVDMLLNKMLEYVKN